jgi:hypothetical protein
MRVLAGFVGCSGSDRGRTLVVSPICS